MQRHFQPSLILTVVVAILLPLCLYLGYWQLQRADQKRELQAEYDARNSGAPVPVYSHVQPVEELQFYRVVAQGYYEPDYQLLIDNRVHQGHAGYHVVTPLRLQGSDVRLLVNRGWIPLGDDRAHLPRIDTPQNLQEVVGVATVPSEKGFTLGKPEPISNSWQPVWQHLDLARYAETAPFPIQPVVLLLDSESPAGGFTREWGRLDAGIAVHQGYAFQWFMLAVALLGIYLFVGWRAAPRRRLRSH